MGERKNEESKTIEARSIGSKSKGREERLILIEGASPTFSAKTRVFRFIVARALESGRK